MRKLSIVNSTISYEGASVSRSIEINYYSALVLQAGGGLDWDSGEAGGAGERSLS